MNKKAQQAAVGFALVLVLFVLVLALFSTIDPLKESLDNARDTTSLNCPGTTNHNVTSYNEDDSLAKLTRRPTCFVTGLSMVWFIATFLIAAVVWVVNNWRKAKP